MKGCKKGHQQKPQTNKHEAEATTIKADFQAEKKWIHKDHHKWV